MNGPATYQTRQHEARTAEEHISAWTMNDLLLYAVRAVEEAGVSVGHTKLVKTIRKAHRLGGIRFALVAVGVLIDSKSWAGFELFVNGYADPTGAHAARNADLRDSGVEC